MGWKDNSISSPSSEMGDTVRTGLPHSQREQDGFECLDVNASGLQEARNASLESRCFLLNSA